MTVIYGTMPENHQFSQIQYVSQYGLGLVVFYWQEEAFFKYHIFHGLPPPPLSIQ